MLFPRTVCQWHKQKRLLVSLSLKALGFGFGLANFRVKGLGCRFWGLEIAVEDLSPHFFFECFGPLHLKV